MWNKNVIQTREKAPQEEERGENPQRAYVTIARRSKQGALSASRVSYHLSCRHMLFLDYQIKSFPGSSFDNQTPALPPGLSLHAEAQATRFTLKRNSSNKAAQAVRPGCIGHKDTQHGPAKNFRPAPICGAMVNLRSQPSY